MCDAKTPALHSPFDLTLSSASLPLKLQESTHALLLIFTTLFFPTFFCVPLRESITMRFPFVAKRSPTDPLFFYSLQNDSCDYDGETFPASNNTENGDLCAYIPGTNPTLLYACPAPDSVCWSFSRKCTGKNSTTPGTNQISCNNNGNTNWCCDSIYDSCTQSYGQINVCWGKNFVNPNKGVSPSAAASIASSAISISQASALNSRLSAISVTGTPSKTSSTAKGTGTSGAKSGGPSGTGHKSDSLSGGAIAGIVIGALAIAIILALFALLFLHRRKKARMAAPPGVYEAGEHQSQHDYYAAAEPKKLEPPQAPLAELPAFEAPSELAGETRYME
jgi:hypothetical protein